MAQRDAERLRREKQVEDVLADFYQAQGEVERIRAAAEVAAAPFEAKIRESVRSLDRLGETRPGIAGLTGLPSAQVRDCLSDAAPSAQAASVADKRARHGHLVAGAETHGEQAPAGTSVARSGS